MGIEPHNPLCKSSHLRDYDYSRVCLYFITICSHQRRHLFGDVVDGSVRLSDAGATVATVWKDTSRHHAGVATDAFVVMPNHIHGIVSLEYAAARSNMRAAIPSVAEIVRAFQRRCLLALGRESGALGNQVWQEIYHVHIIRDQQAYAQAVDYIEANPRCWQQDIYYENPWAAIFRTWSPAGAAALRRTRQDSLA